MNYTKNIGEQIISDANIELLFSLFKSVENVSKEDKNNNNAYKNNNR